VAEARGQFGNRERERLPLEVISRGLMKTQLTDKTSMRVVMNCRVCETAIALQLL
jgi:hypothetical protein